MTIEILAFLTLVIIGLIALAVYRDYRRDKAEAELDANFEESAKALAETFSRYRASLELHRISVDELGMQSAAYAEYEDTPPFITEALERRADTELAENEELPDWARRWLEESEDGE